MKILWFSNRLFTDDKIKGTGTWLDSMADILIKEESIQLFNITQGYTKKISQINYNGIQQYLLPNQKLRSNGLPSQKLIKQIIHIVDSINPDIIHIWGTESYWGLLSSRGHLNKGLIILEIQGLVSQIKKYVFGGLTIHQLFQCINIKEVLKPSTSVFSLKRKFTQKSKHELEIISSHSFISTQSEWVRSHISFHNPNARILKTKIPLRKEFVGERKWIYDQINSNVIFTSISSNAPYKGMHTLIDAVSILKKSFPNVKLLIAGYVGSGLRESGYVKFLKKKIVTNGLIDNVIWLGPQNEEEIVTILSTSHVAVFPSLIESYGVAVAESLSLGVPTITSYSGALPEQGIDGESILFFPPGDTYVCAYKIKKIFDSNSIAERLSKNASKYNRNITNNEIAKIQLSIYKEVLNNGSNINC